MYFVLILKNEIDRALWLISVEVSALLKVEFDAFSANVTLLDAFRDVSVPSKKSYLDTLTKQEVSRLNRHNYGVASYYNGFTWHSQNRRIRIYDKFLQLCAKHAEQLKKSEKRKQPIQPKQLKQLQVIRDFCPNFNSV